MTLIFQLTGPNVFHVTTPVQGTGLIYSDWNPACHGAMTCSDSLVISAEAEKKVSSIHIFFHYLEMPAEIVVINRILCG